MHIAVVELLNRIELVTILTRKKLLEQDNVQRTCSLSNVIANTLQTISIQVCLDDRGITLVKKVSVGIILYEIVYPGGGGE